MDVVKAVVDDSDNAAATMAAAPVKMCFVIIVKKKKNYYVARVNWPATSTQATYSYKMWSIPTPCSWKCACLTRGIIPTPTAHLGASCSLKSEVAFFSLFCAGNKAK